MHRVFIIFQLRKIVWAFFIVVAFIIALSIFVVGIVGRNDSLENKPTL